MWFNYHFLGKHPLSAVFGIRRVVLSVCYGEKNYPSTFFCHIGHREHGIHMAFDYNAGC
jgi:hypothetical protein